MGLERPAELSAGVRGLRLEHQFWLSLAPAPCLSMQRDLDTPSQT